MISNFLNKPKTGNFSSSHERTNVALALGDLAHPRVCHDPQRGQSKLPQARVRKPQGPPKSCGGARTV